MGLLVAAQAMVAQFSQAQQRWSPFRLLPLLKDPNINIILSVTMAVVVILHIITHITCGHS
jgi:hypothetical protein